MMEPRGYQVQLATEAASILREHMMVYLAWEERTGKSLTGILVAEQIKAEYILIVTKKKASKDWVALITNDYSVTKVYTVTTYGQAYKLLGKKWDLIILDESHNYISSYPKASATWKKMKQLCTKTPLIYMSATPHAQGYQLLYHQFALSTWSPFRTYSNFYNWFRVYGKPYVITCHGKEVNQYDRTDEQMIGRAVDHLFITKTRKQLGFSYEPKDKLHYIELKKCTKEYYNTLVTDKVLVDLPQPIIADTVMRFRSSLHMLEGGVMKATLYAPPVHHDNLVKVVKEKVDDLYVYHSYYVLSNHEKITYIKKCWGDKKNMVIMYNFIPEGIKLREAFKYATVVQATSYAEGVDYTDKEHLIIYSQDYSTARHTQRRARQAGKDRSSTINVNFLLVKKGISEEVYNTVAVNKQNYVDSRFTRTKI